MSHDDGSKKVIECQGSRLATEAERARVRTLFAENGFQRSQAEVDWIYRPCRGVLPHATFASCGGKTAGLYAAVPSRFWLDGESVEAAQSLDTMVDERFRGMGLFTKLASRAYEDMSRDGVAFVFGFPNGNSHHGFVTKLDWISLDPVPFLFRPLRVGYVLGRLMPWFRGRLRLPVPILGARGRSEALGSLPDAEKVDRLWERVRAGLSVARERTASYLAERFEAKPGSRYRFRAIERDGELLGLAIFCCLDKHGGRIGYLMDAMVDPAHGSLAAGLIRDVLSDMARDGCDGCLAWCFEHSQTYRAHLKSGFLPLPERIRPQELHLGVRPLADLARGAFLGERRNWYISYSDSDTV